MYYGDKPQRRQDRDTDAIDWLLAVRLYGLAEANRMFPEDSDR